MSSDLHVIYPLYWSDFNKTLPFLTVFQKILKYEISWKSIQWQSSSVQTDRHYVANNRFSQFCGSA
jgi:hypothetical protein